MIVNKIEAELNIKKFLNEMASQDNRGTAAPYYYVIKTEEEYNCPLEDALITKVYYDGETYSSMEELKEVMESEAASDEWIANVLREACEYGSATRWVYEGLFFTETAAKNHLESNRHHYSKNACTYVKHARRSPELTLFLKGLFTYFEVKEGDYVLTT